MIAIDIGNTNLDFALIKQGKIKKVFKVLTKGVTKDTLFKLLSRYKLEPIFVCSVVPTLVKTLKSLKLPIYVVDKDVKIPIKSYYDKNKVGMDRLVGAYAAKKFFPRTRLILDFGTAITLDFLNKQGDYQGGLILPGVGSTLDVLANCALLPKRIAFKNSKRIIPTNTNESITRGVQEGFSSMLNSLVGRYKKTLKISSSVPVIVTGGSAPIVLKKLNFPLIYKPFLVLHGLDQLAKNTLKI